MGGLLWQSEYSFMLQVLIHWVMVYLQKEKVKWCK